MRMFKLLPLLFLLFQIVNSTPDPTSINILSFNIKNEIQNNSSSAAQNPFISSFTKGERVDLLIIIGITTNELPKLDFANVILFGNDTSNGTSILIGTNWELGDSEFKSTQGGSLLFSQIQEPVKSKRDNKPSKIINFLLGYFPTEILAQKVIMNEALELLERRTSFGEDPTYFIADFGVRGDDDETAIPMLFTPKENFGADFVDGYLMCYYTQGEKMQLDHTFPATYNTWRSQRLYFRGKASVQEFKTVHTRYFENSPIEAKLQAFVPPLEKELVSKINNILRTQKPDNPETTGPSEPTPQKEQRPVAKPVPTNIDDLLPITTKLPPKTIAPTTEPTVGSTKPGVMLAGYSMTAITITFGVMILVAVLSIWFWRRRRTRQSSPSYASLDLVVKDNSRLVD